jgi:chromate transporter
VLPAFFLILGLSYAYVTYGEVDWVGSVFDGLRSAVIGLVAAALIRIGQNALRNPAMNLIAGAAFVAIFLLHLPFPLIVLSAGMIGLVAAPIWPGTFTLPSGQASVEEEPAISDSGAASVHPPVGLGRATRVLVMGLAAWFGPLLLVALWRGDDTLTQQAWFFSRAAMVTFGGAYAVLAYINQAAVTQFGWLAPGQMVTGLGLAESTPGPLIMVTEFVGFVGAYQHPGDLDPVLAGVLGAAVATWATFAPCFLWIFLGAPFIEHLRGNLRLSSALGSITAAVVGVVLNLTVWFGIHTIFQRVREVDLLGGLVPVPVWGSVDWFALLIAAATFVGLWRYRWNVVPVVLGSAIAGAAYGSVA